MNLKIGARSQPRPQIGSSALASRFRPFRIPRLLLRSQGVFFLRAANILLRTTGLQNFCALVQLIGLTRARALLFAFSRWRLVNSVSALIRHYFSSTFRPSENSPLVLEPFRAESLLSSSSTIRIVA